MIEKVVRDYLATETGLPAYMEIPEKPDDEYLIVEKTGSGRENHINRATIAVQSYSRKSLLRAATINEQVKTVMDSLIELPEISRSQLNSDYNYTDTTTATYRYQAVYDIVY